MGRLQHMVMSACLPDSSACMLLIPCSCPAGYTASIVYCLIVLLLYHTQQDLENPFDMNGMVRAGCQRAC